MGTVHADITLKNLKDTLNAKDGSINEEEIRQTTVEVIVDTGAMSLVINDEVRRHLGLEIIGEKSVRFGNASKEIVKRAGPVEVHWKNRDIICQPLVTSESGPILLGVIPLEGMDLMVDPVRQELVGAHGDEEIQILY